MAFRYRCLEMWGGSPRYAGAFQKILYCEKKVASAVPHRVGERVLPIPYLSKVVHV